jgi:PAS domain S-box-containing protein
MHSAHRVLYVDDEPELLLIAKRFLEKEQDFVVDTLTTAHAALEQLNKVPYDAIVSDYQMPEMDGIKFLIRVRAEFGEIPFILFTGKGREDLVIEAINNGADFYLQKGGDPKSQFAELTHKINKAVDQKQAEKALKSSEQRLSDIINFLPDATFAIDLEGKVIAWNLAMEEMTGVKKDSIIGKGDHEYALPFYSERRPLLLDLVLKNDGKIKEKYPFVKYQDNKIISQLFIQPLFNGRGAYLWFIASPLYDTRGAVIGAVESIRDITEQKRAEDALSESEEKFRSLAESSPDYIMRYDRECRHIYMNPAALRVSGLTEEQIIGKTHRESGFDETQSQFWEEKITRVFETGEPFQIQFEWEGVNGRMFLDWMLTPEFSEDKSVHSVLGVSRDITQIKKAEEGLLRKNEELNASYEQISASEEELRSNYDELSRQERALHESEGRFRALIQNATDIIRIINADGYIVYDSPSSSRILGYPPGFTIGKRPLEFIHPDDQEHVQEALGEVYTRKNPGTPTEFRIRKADGSYIFVETVASNLIGTPGIEGVVTTTRPIEERKNTENALRKSEEKYRLIIDQTEAGVWIIDKDYHTTFVNKRLASMFGFTPEEMMGKPVREFMPADEMPIHNQRVRERLAGKSERFEQRFFRKDGSVFWAIASVTPLAEENSVTGAFAILTDITERKRDEEALSHLTEFQHSVITNARVWLSVLDLKGTILMWNTAAEEISGYRSAEVIGQKDIWKKIYPDKEYRKQITDTITRIIREENYLENFETTILSKQGTKKVISWNTRGIPDATGSISDYIAIGLDVTDRNLAEEALRESEQRMKDIINFLPDATLVVDKTGTVLAWNRAIEVMTGVPADQMIGKGNYEYALPFYHERRPITVDLVLHEDPEVVAKYPVMEKEGMSIRSEIFLPHLNEGRGAYLWFIASPLYNSSGDIIGAIESIRDITERKQAEEALITSQGLLAEAMDLAHMANWEFDAATGIFTFDDRFYDLYGTTEEREGGNQMPAEVYAKNFVHPDDQYLVAEEVNKANQATDPGYVSQVEHRIIRRDGEVRNIVVRFGITKDENGRTIKIQGANQDITERKRAEQAQLDSEARFRKILEKAPLPLCYVNADGVINFRNERFVQILGYSADEVPTLTEWWQQAYPDPNYRQWVTTIWDAALKRATEEGIDIKPVEYKVTCKSGEERIIEISGITMGDNFLAMLIDLTERKRDEQALQEANKKLNLLSSITRHDINNQLLALNGFLRLLRDKATDPAFEDFFTRITKASSRISAMIKFTKEYEEIGVHAPHWQNTRNLVENAVNEVPLGQIMVKNDLPAGIEVFTDPLIVKVFYNLMDNAIRYGGKITTIRFSAEESGKDCLIVCEDDGVGIPTEEKEKIFERGFGKNTGMGLFLAREILSITGITITETGVPGKGARFEIMVPTGGYRKQKGSP